MQLSLSNSSNAHQITNDPINRKVLRIIITDWVNEIAELHGVEMISCMPTVDGSLVRVIMNHETLTDLCDLWETIITSEFADYLFAKAKLEAITMKTSFSPMARTGTLQIGV